ncbi:MAG: PrgI family protein [Ruminococcus flavefaciens]|nr:PrgI family protein [Ruminococcus flavefaciens]
MEVKINKEIRNYTESMFFGLSLRQFIFSVLACGVAVGLYFLLRPHFGTETLSWVCILGASPFAMMGFVKYNGMTAEQFVWAWIKSEFLMPKKLMFLPDNLYYEALKPNIEACEKGLPAAQKKQKQQAAKPEKTKKSKKRKEADYDKNA